MAEVLAPISTTTTMTINPQDAYKNQNNTSLTAARKFPRHSMYNMPTNMNYRGPSSVPITPYAFQNTPNLQPQQAQLSSVPQNFRAQYQDSSASSISSASSSSNRSARQQVTSKDDSVLNNRKRQSFVDPRFTQNYSASMSTPDLSLPPSPGFDTRSSPDRNRRPKNFENQRPRPMSSSFAVHAPQRSWSDHVEMKRASIGNHMRSYDESAAINAARYRRRSGLGRLESNSAVNLARPHSPHGSSAKQQYGHARSSSYGDARSPQTSPIKPKMNRPPTYTSNSSPLSQDNRPKTAPALNQQPMPSPTPSPVPSINQRPSTANPNTRSASMPANLTPRPQTPAVQQLTALSEKNENTLKARLRRAFSFSSSSELRKASAENNMVAERAKLRKQRFETDDEIDPIAAQQEAAGLGENIYTHQGAIAASTDNISISSTASSASIMLRKMGAGVKKSTRNLRNLFRPKSMHGGDEAISGAQTTAEVSMVTVEAERERVNVNLDPHDKPGGGTGYPKLENNSLEQNASDSPPGSPGDIRSRKSIIAGEKERAEVLAAVRKGILKRTPTSNSSSPVIPQGEGDGSTIADESSPATSREGSMSGGYFNGLHHDGNLSTRSLPTVNRNISFNNKVQFFDVWSPNEYDRRGEIATCNRLTPILAQQIKEELNTFKMEMEVHEDSKPHTHFF